MTIPEKLKENYKHLEQSIVSQLQLKATNHHLTTGHYREAIWEDLFRQILPQKFSIKQGVFLIDSLGNTSAEIDIAVFDEQYTPYIFNYGKVYYIPIEAVAIVVQCKSKTLNAKKLNDWCNTIEVLQTAKGAIARMANQITVDNAPTQPATKPIKILCSLSAAESIDCFDIKIAVKNSKLNINFHSSLQTLMDALSKFNGLEKLEDVISHRKNIADIQTKMETKIKNYEVTGSSILSLIFQLNQLLMLINNPMLFPHRAYVNLFNKE